MKYQIEAYKEYSIPLTAMEVNSLYHRKTDVRFVEDVFLNCPNTKRPTRISSVRTLKDKLEITTKGEKHNWKYTIQVEEILPETIRCPDCGSHLTSQGKFIRRADIPKIKDYHQKRTLA